MTGAQAYAKDIRCFGASQLEPRQVLAVFILRHINLLSHLPMWVGLALIKITAARIRLASMTAITAMHVIGYSSSSSAS